MKLKTQKNSSATVALAAVLSLVFLPTGLLYAQRVGSARAVASEKVNGNVNLNAARPFETGEELVYVAEFSRSLLKKVDVADFRFSVNRVPASQKIGDRQSTQEKGGAYLLKLNGVISSRGFFSKLFNLHFREEIESTVEPTSFQVKRTMKTDEQGKRVRVSESTYDNGVVHWVERDPKNPANGVREASAKFQGQVQDLLSAIYYLRTQPLEPGKTLVVNISDSGRVFRVPVRVVEKKRMKTALGRVETVRTDAEVFGANGMIPSEGHFWIWFTNDSRHIPVSARIKNEYGTFEITLRKVLQNPAAKPAMSRAADLSQ
jgi:hypothetical protein